jgi:hypothetical protein
MRGRTPLVGLCASCLHLRITGNRRGSQFFLCELSKTDARFRRYPPLPVLHCAGFEPRSDSADGSPHDDYDEPETEE